VTHLHAHFAHSPAAVAYLASVAGGPSFSFTAHAKDLYTTLPRNIRIRARAARFVLTCTEANGRHLRELLENDVSVPVHVVHHGTDLERFSPARRRPEPGLIVSVGRLVPKKGFSVLVDAMGNAAGGGLDFRCEVYGGGPMRAELEARVHRLGLEKRLSFHGARPLDDIVAAYTRAMVFVLAPAVLDNGDRDGIPNVLVEAMAAGVPVVSTRVSGIPELIDDGENGLLVEPSDANALAAAIRRVLENPRLAARLASAGRRKVEREFDVVANSRRIAELLAEGEELAPRSHPAVVA
jgi:glycosyltransferase involved in cell wall biosynthesis